MLSRIRTYVPENGLHRIVDGWKSPADSVGLLRSWPNDFSRGVQAVQCHSHNDYEHKVPLFEALLAGCSSIEADVWLQDQTHESSALLVGHERRFLQADRTLANLYINPLKLILNHQASGGDAGFNGVFSSSPNTTLVLLLDFKSADELMWNAVQEALQPLRDGGWLTYWTATTGVVKGPITVVGTGEAPFEQIVANTTYRDVFYDAPLDRLDGSFNSSNSYYASVSFGRDIGTSRWGRISSNQSAKISHQIGLAQENGLLARYWDTPTWPIGWRNRLWDTLVGLGVDVLNVDDLSAATRWDWAICVVGGIVLCS